MESKTFDFTFSRENIDDIPLNMYENNFTFIVNGKSYQTNRFIADLLSPYIRKLHFADKLIDSFNMDINFTQKQKNASNSNENDFFSDFLKFIPIDEKQKSTRQIYYSEYFNKLGNITEYCNLQHQFFDGLTVENSIERLISLSKLEKNSSFEFGKKIYKIIDFISSNFEKVNKEEMEQLDLCLIERILNNEKLILEEEDSLLNFILELYSKSESFSPLFEYVNFENVSIKSFEEFINSFEIQSINQSIWESICCRFLTSNDYIKLKKFQRSQKIREFQYEKGRDFEGIMHYLTEKTGGNIHDNGTIEITTNSMRLISDHPKNLVNYTANNYYHSLNDGKAEICFDFKENLVQVSSYSIKSNHNDGPNSYNLRNWVVEVSNDKKNWIIIDKNVNNPSLNGRNIVLNFNVQKKNNAFYRFVRIRQTGDSWSASNNPNYFWFYFIEFFGKIKEKRICKINETC